MTVAFCGDYKYLSNVLESENVNVDALVSGKSDIGGTSLSIRFEWVQY